MDESKLEETLYEKLASIYDERQLRHQEPLESGFRPDIMVLDEDEEPYLIAEAKISSSIDGQEEAIRQIRKYLDLTDAPFAAYVTEQRNHIFKHVEINGINLQISIDDFPTNSKDFTDRRGFNNYSELVFCTERAKMLVSRETSLRASDNQILQELQRLVVSENIDQQITPQSEEFSDQLREIDRTIKEKYPFHSPTYSDQDIAQSRIIQGIFYGYSLKDTSNEVLHEFISDFLFRSDTESQHGTPELTARYIANQLEINSDESVIDPAIGRGNILREISKTNPDSEKQGIELNPTVAQTTTAINSILGTEMKIEVGDAISKPYNSRNLQSNFDHVVLDPPIGMRPGSEDLPQQLQDWAGYNIEDIFLYSALEYLKVDGKLTAIIPLGILDRKKSEKLREKLISNHHVKKIIQIDKGSFYSSINADLALVQIKKTEPRTDDLTKFIVLEKFEEKEEIESKSIIKEQIEISLPNKTSKETLVPSKILAKRDIENRFQRTYSELLSLGDIATEIRSGVRIPSQETWSDGESKYLQISDVTEGSSSPRFVDKSEIENITFAGPSDLLISTAGSVDVTYVPDEQLIPHSNWTIVRFENHQIAKIYQAFFSTILGTDLLKSLSKGSTIPHLPNTELRNAKVPFFSEDTLRDLQSELDEIGELQQGRVKSSTADKIEEILRRGNL